ncbi:helix-turn-helix transcriptional regulator [Streptomyces sp. QTS52]
MLRNLTDGDDEWLLQERRRIGERIREARLLRNLTQEDVFLAVPVARSFYQDIEAGQANPALVTLLRIARVLDMSLADLVR